MLGEKQKTEPMFYYVRMEDIVPENRDHIRASFMRRSKDALINEKIQSHIPIMDYRSQNDRGIYPIERFSFERGRNIFICSEGKGLKYWGHTQRQQTACL